MIAPVSTSQGSSVEIARRYLSAEGELSWSNAVIFVAAGGANAQWLHSPHQSTEYLRHTELTS